jgi:protein-S-isoprenylcysteine O-methyltransferase Ste14
MRRPTAAAGSALFFAIAPGVVAGLVPWWLTRWRVRGPLAHWAPARMAGLTMLILGAIVLVQAFARFVEGHGTPDPLAPAQHLVTGGLYRYVRNPMYLAVVAAITGQALALGQPALLGYAAVVLVAVASFARWYEEPALTRQFGEQPGRTAGRLRAPAPVVFLVHVARPNHVKSPAERGTAGTKRDRTTIQKRHVRRPQIVASAPDERISRLWNSCPLQIATLGERPESGAVSNEAADGPRNPGRYR